MFKNEIRTVQVGRKVMHGYTLLKLFRINRANNIVILSQRLIHLVF